MPRNGQYDPDSGVYTVDETGGGNTSDYDRARNGGAAGGPTNPYSGMPSDYVAVNGYGKTPGGQSAAPSSPAGPNFTWNGSPYSGGGLTGSGSQFGNNFIGMQGYLNANKTPGLTNSSYQTYSGGPMADYSKNMNNLDQSVYGFYGVQPGSPPQQAAAPAAGTTASASPAASAPSRQDVTNNYVNMQNKLKTGGRTYVQ